MGGRRVQEPITKFEDRGGRNATNLAKWRAVLVNGAGRQHLVYRDRVRIARDCAREGRAGIRYEGPSAGDCVKHMQPPDVVGYNRQSAGRPRVPIDRIHTVKLVENGT